MLLNYVKSAHRNVMRNKVASLIQLFSLAIGLCVFILVALYLYDELTVDRQNEYLQDVYRVEMPKGSMAALDVVSILLGPLMESEIAELSHMTRVFYEPTLSIAYSRKDTKKTTFSQVSGSLIVDAGFWQIFPQEVILGDPDLKFDEPHTIVLTESLARKLFKEDNPLGKTVMKWNAIPTKVIGVIKDPKNTHLKFEVLAPSETWFDNRKQHGMSIKDLELLGISHPCYIRLNPGANVHQVEEKIEQLVSRHDQRIFKQAETFPVEVSLRPLSEVHFADIDPSYDYMNHVDRKDLLIFFFIALGILLLAMINYINLATARATLRSREIALRLINGSSRKSLIFYFLVESIITTLFAFLVAATLAQIFFPSFNYLLQADINLYFLRSPLSWLFTLLCIVFFGILAGLYPALKLSSNVPLSVFPGPSGKRAGGLMIRRILMVIQFTSSVILLIVILSMQGQIKYMHSSELGFSTEGVFHMGTGSSNNKMRRDLLVEIKQIPEVEFVCLSQPVPGFNRSEDVPLVDDPESVFNGLELKTIDADLDFFKVYDLKFTQGAENINENAMKSFALDTVQDRKHQLYVINESARKILGIENAIGQPMSVNGWGRIVGVIEDFHYQSLEHPVKPMAIWLRTNGEPWHLSVKIKSKDLAQTMTRISRELRNSEGEWTKWQSEVPFVLSQSKYIGDTFAQQYEPIERLQTASTYLSIMAVIIACLGLFGLSAFMAQRRVKEIGIRKVVGASERAIFVLLARDFLKWVSLSVVIGLPLGYLVIQKWQQQFAFRASFDIWMYLVTVAIVFFVSHATVAFHSIKASRTNPADSLRTE